MKAAPDESVKGAGKGSESRLPPPPIIPKAQPVAPALVAEVPAVPKAKLEAERKKKQREKEKKRKELELAAEKRAAEAKAEEQRAAKAAKAELLEEQRAAKAAKAEQMELPPEDFEADVRPEERTEPEAEGDLSEEHGESVTSKEMVGGTDDDSLAALRSLDFGPLEELLNHTAKLSMVLESAVQAPMSLPASSMPCEHPHEDHDENDLISDEQAYAEQLYAQQRYQEQFYQQHPSMDSCTDQGYADYESMARAEEDEQFYLESQRQRVEARDHPLLHHDNGRLVEERAVQDARARKPKPRKRKSDKGAEEIATRPSGQLPSHALGPPGVSVFRIALPFIGIFLTFVLYCVQRGPQWTSSSAPDVDFVSKALLNEFSPYPAAAINDEVSIKLTLAVHRLR